jgi:hypothetical protein
MGYRRLNRVVSKSLMKQNIVLAWLLSDDGFINLSIEHKI